MLTLNLLTRCPASFTHSSSPGTHPQRGCPQGIHVPTPAPAVRQALRTGADPSPLYTHPSLAAWQQLPHIQQGCASPPARATPPVPALYLLSGGDGEGEGVHACAVVQQDSSNPLAVLLIGEGLIPVPSAPVLLRSCAILQAEHDGDIHIFILPILHLPDEHSYR